MTAESRRSDPCRRPDKYRHRSKGAALAQIQSLEKAGKGHPDMEAYRCGDHWHIGHSQRALVKRIRRALKIGGRR